MQYNFWHSVLKTLVRLSIILIPVAMTWLPKEWMNITLGGGLMLSFDWLKAKFASL